MEGPSLFLAAEQLQPFAGRMVCRVSGNSRIGIERLHRKRIRRIFSWGKHLVFQFDSFALRVHFMLWGTFAATVEGVPVTGDYRRSGPPRLVLEFSNGEITVWSASLRFLKSGDARVEYDFASDVLSDSWDPRAAIRKMRRHPNAQIADVLLDQSIFGGVGNIIKNEVLFRTRHSPFATVSSLSPQALKRIVTDARVFSFRFLELRREFALRKNLEIYGRSVCSLCAGKVTRRVHGTRERRSFFCIACQRVRVPREPGPKIRAKTIPPGRRRAS
ncbi:MAG: endonuclease [Vicinamibacterales bacterium]